ncbi:MAG: N6-L-threonylcarbamoyladenine synthase [Sphingobacteriales bacterium]|jgi:N6-L-threonylcarbamoyladenine synthase
MAMVILGIESSCDDTSASIVIDGKVKSNVVAGQDVHKEYGGVIPELASRAHQQNIIPVVQSAIEKGGVKKEDLSAIAFTRGPGLLGPLLVGTCFAKSFASGLDIPIIEVNHIQAHIFAHFIDDPKPKFPFLCLTVSGGHTQIVLVRDYFDMEIVGSTQDDAAGEAFDKSAKILNLPYPGGPLVDKYANLGDIHRFPFPEAKVGGFDFSFSGLKTSILYFVRREMHKNPEFINENLNDICASIQHRIVTTLLNKVKKAANELKVTQVAVAGGVSANSFLRKYLTDMAVAEGWETYIPDFQYCTDNAGMIAITGYYKYLKKEFTTNDVSPLPRMPY